MSVKYCMQWKLGMCSSNPQMPLLPSESYAQAIEHVCLPNAILKRDISRSHLWHQPVALGFPLQRAHGMASWENEELASGK